MTTTIHPSVPLLPSTCDVISVDHPAPPPPRGISDVQVARDSFCWGLCLALDPPFRNPSSSTTNIQRGGTPSKAFQPRLDSHQTTTIHQITRTPPPTTHVQTIQLNENQTLTHSHAPQQATCNILTTTTTTTATSPVVTTGHPLQENQENNNIPLPYMVQRPLRLISISYASRMLYLFATLTVMIILTLSQHTTTTLYYPSVQTATSTPRHGRGAILFITFWALLHLLTLFSYLAVGYNPGYLVPLANYPKSTQGEEQLEESERHDGTGDRTYPDPPQETGGEETFHQLKQQNTNLRPPPVVLGLPLTTNITNHHAASLQNTPAITASPLYTQTQLHAQPKEKTNDSSCFTCNVTDNNTVTTAATTTTVAATTIGRRDDSSDQEDEDGICLYLVPFLDVYSKSDPETSNPISSSSLSSLL